MKRKERERGAKIERKIAIKYCNKTNVNTCSQAVCYTTLDSGKRTMYDLLLPRDER